MNDNTTVVFRPSDGDVRFTLGPARTARNILVHEREICDECYGEDRLYVWTYDNSVNEHPTMLVLCMDCSPDKED